MPTIEAKLDRIESLLSASRPEAHLRYTLSDIWSRYKEAHRHGRWWHNVESCVRYSLAEFGARELGGLAPSDWHGYAKRVRSHVKASVRNNELKRWKAVIRWAKREGILPATWIHPWETIKPEPYRHVRGSELTEEQLQKMLRHALPNHRALFLLAFDTGMRRGEITGLMWEWVDLDKEVIYLPWHITKTRTSRTVVMTPRAADALRQLRPVGEDELHGHVFVRRDGQPYHYYWATQVFHDAIERIGGVKPAPGDGSVHLHDLRGTAASNMARQGATLKDLKDQIGWTNNVTPSKYIARHNDDDVERRRKLLRGPRKPHQGEP